MTLEWIVKPGLSPYEPTIQAMDNHVNGMIQRQLPENIWLIEHPSIYTMGTSANDQDILRSELPIFKTGRGGKVTYHGPGQRVVYIMLDLKKRQQDIRCYLDQLQQWIIAALGDLGILGHTCSDRIGVWVKYKNSEAKIAAIGIRIRKWVTFHGFAINVSPDLKYFNTIIPCGLSEYGVTSLQQMGIDISPNEFDQILYKCYYDFF